MRLSGRTALITGAASGIGEEIARTFAREGAQVAIADISADAARAVAAAINAHGGKAVGLSMDVTVERDVNDGMASVFAQFGAIDILVSNAGIQIVNALEEFTFGEWNHVLSVHLNGAFLTTKAWLAHNKASGRGGTVLYMGSVHSKEASLLKAPYVTAKHGLLGLARAVAKEGARHGVRANVICPGFVRTPLVERQIPEQARALGISEEAVIRDVMLKETVDGKFTTPEDVAEAAVFFASLDSGALTGQSLIVSHGWHME